MPFSIAFELSGSFWSSRIVSERRLSICASLSKRYEGNSSNRSKYSIKSFFLTAGSLCVAADFIFSKSNFSGFGFFSDVRMREFLTMLFLYKAAQAGRLLKSCLDIFIAACTDTYDRLFRVVDPLAVF